MRFLFAAVRGVTAIAIVVAVSATFADSAASYTVNPFNFFGYFTIQGNIAAAVVLALAAVVGARGRTQPTWLVFARACAASYMAVVGLVYNTLLIGLAAGAAVPWANFVLHVVAPILVVLDWVLFSDRHKLSWRSYPFVLVYPLVWTIVVLIRGATDGWVPYPFLDPAQGYGVVAIYVVIVALAFAASGAGAWALTRSRILTLPTDPAVPTTASTAVPRAV